MDPINGLNQILQLVRARLARTDQPRPQPAGATRSNARATPSPSKVSAEQIKRKLQERIGAVEDTEAGTAQAIRIFVETVLIWEFGEELLNDSRFTELAGEVSEQINIDKVAKTRIMALLKDLRRL